MTTHGEIVIRGAREHNLKNVSLKLPRNKLIVITGISGSGKSSLAFDTLFAEGQRRYVESLSAYARQFLEQMQKPDVDSIEGLSPAISIDQKGQGRNPRSTVGTVTEIYDYLRLLYAHIGIPHCHQCGRRVLRQTTDQIADQILALPHGAQILLLAPVVSGRKGEYQTLLKDLQKEGFLRARVDGELIELGQPISLDKKRKHSIELVVDRLTVKPEIQSRLNDSIETGLRYGSGVIMVDKAPGADVEGKFPMIFSEKFACPHCGVSLSEITPRIFSFNSPYGACPECSGLGDKLEFDPDLIIPDRNLTISEGGIAPWVSSGAYYFTQLRALGDKYGFDLETPVKQFTKKQIQVLLYGSGDDKVPVRYDFTGGKGQGYYESAEPFEGIVSNLKRRYTETQSEHVRFSLYRYMSPIPCAVCNGARLKPESLAVKVGDISIADFTKMSTRKALAFIDQLELSDREKTIAAAILKEIRARLTFLVNVGLDYLSLSRVAFTLSGGESQRIRLATQIGSSLVGVLYILDEPSIGLHQRDNQRLIETLEKLRNLGNTLVVVEHDEEMIRSADHVVDIGPGAGVHGGHVVATGSVTDIKKATKSITGAYLSGRREITVPKIRRPGNGKFLTVHKASHNNLKNVDVKFPLGCFVGVTGVSGSGKSSLVNDILYKALAKHYNRAVDKAGAHDHISGLEHIDKVIIIDQSPIGRTPRSNPATYTGVFDPIRELFSFTEDARLHGYKPGRFSFNVKGGRCEACHGDGMVKIEMHFLPDVYVPCEVCKGKRYNRETLEIRYKTKTISEVLGMTVEEAHKLFENIPAIAKKLKTLVDVGLGYIKLGQSATTLSGGEAQRIKLATELSHRSTGQTLYLLDEPTTGLHFEDIRKLLEVLQQLVNTGNTVIVIEHNLDVIKTVDHIIDLGPDGGDAGGEIVAEGTPEEVAKIKRSYTGQFLKSLLR